MQYLYTYLTVCFIIANIILIKVNHNDISKFFKSKLNFKQFFYILSINLSICLLIYILFPFIWPLLIVSKNKEHQNKMEEEKSKFRVEFKDLIQKFDLTEIENNEIVHDPLEAVPPIPFGHLHKAWLTFCEQLKAEDELWSFSANWTPRWGSTEHIEGYAVVRKGAIGPYFQAH